MRMPFGKHKGSEINDIDSDYLYWLIDNSKSLSNSLTYYINITLQKREDADPKIKKAFHVMCKKYHADKGGSDIEMKVVLDFYNTFKKL
jgi:hypothetical protein